MVNFEFAKLAITNTAKVAQLVESQVVVLVVAGSIPVLRPKEAVFYAAFFFGSGWRNIKKGKSQKIIFNSHFISKMNNYLLIL